MSSPRERRIMKELLEYANDPLEGVSIENVSDDYSMLDVSLIGPSNTIYEGGVFYLEINYPVEYPFKPPKVRITTKIIHLHIGRNCEHCGEGISELAYERWMPKIKIKQIVSSFMRSLINWDDFWSVGVVKCPRMSRSLAKTLQNSSKKLGYKQINTQNQNNP